MNKQEGGLSEAQLLAGLCIANLVLQGAVVELGELAPGMTVREALIILKAKLERAEQLHKELHDAVRSRERRPFWRRGPFS